MKIAVAAPTYLPALRANTIQVMKMTQAFVELGHTVRLFVPSPKPGKVSHRWEQLAHHYGMQYEFKVDWLRANPFWRGYDFPVRVIRRARQIQADVLFTRHPQTAALASLVGMPVILEAHDLPHGYMGGVLFRLFLRGRGARRLVAITRALAADLQAQFGVSAYAAGKDEPFVTISPDGVDMARYTGLPRPVDAREALKAIPDSPFRELAVERFTAGYTGHLYPGRGSDLLLELARRLPQMVFLFAGGEPGAVARLRSQVNEMGLKNVILTGFLANADLPLAQAACDVLLMPYQERVEASSGGDIGRYLSPMKAFEYLACGRPILASDLAVFREVFSEENALLLPHDDPDAWTQALTALAGDEARRKALGERARQDVRQYEWTRRASTILQGLAL